MSSKANSLQLKCKDIILGLTFDFESSDKKLGQLIKKYRENNGKIDSTYSISSLDKKYREFITLSGKFDVNLYKVLTGIFLGASQAQAGEALPFPEPTQASVTGRTLADSKHQWRADKSHLPKDAPNIVIFMTDDAGFANPEVFGGPVHMPTLERLAKTGISYNAFHTTAMC